jgi:hypothetical protein
MYQGVQQICHKESPQYFQCCPANLRGCGGDEKFWSKFRSENATMVAATGSASCTTSPRACSGSCSVEESAPKKGGALHIDATGSCNSEAVTSGTYDIKLMFNGLPVLNKKAQDATKDNSFSLPLNMGSIAIPAIRFPVAAGSAIKIPTIANVGKLAPSGKLVATVDAYDQDKKALFSIEVDIAL